MTETPVTPEVTVSEGTGAMTATVSTEAVTQAPATEQGGELLAGKFKTQDDLIKAYGELEKKLGQSSQQPAEEAPAAAEAETGETPEGNDAEAKDETPAGESPYGEAVTEVLTKAGLDPAKVAEDFTGSGEISDDVYAKLAEAGYPREMVDAYRRGIQTEAENATTITEAQITQIKAAAGGDAAYAKMTDWMSKSLTAEELAPYNAAVESGDVAKAQQAVTDMRAKYVASVGVEGDLLGGQTAGGVQGYSSEAEMLEDMAKPEYKTSQAFRDKVTAKIAKSSGVFITR